MVRLKDELEAEFEEGDQLERTIRNNLEKLDYGA